MLFLFHLFLFTGDERVDHFCQAVCGSLPVCGEGDDVIEKLSTDRCESFYEILTLQANHLTGVLPWHPAWEGLCSVPPHR